MCKRCWRDAGPDAAHPVRTGRHRPRVIEPPDDAIVHRLIGGEPIPSATALERALAWQQLQLGGMSYAQGARRLRVDPRSIARYTALLRVSA